MPRVPRASPVRLAAPPTRCAPAAIERARRDRRAPTARCDRSRPTRTRPAIGLTLTLAADGDDGTASASTPTGGIDIPFFGWFFRPLVGDRARRARRVRDRDRCGPRSKGAPGAAAAEAGRRPPAGRVHARAGDAPRDRGAPRPRSSSFASALVRPARAARSATRSTRPTRRSASRSRSRALGALFALVRDRARRPPRPAPVDPHRCRRARRSCARSPRSRRTSSFFTGAQVLQRGFVITTATVAGIAVVEEAPEGARAYAASMLALAGGFGFSFVGRHAAARRHRRRGVAHPVRARRARRSSSRRRIARRLAETTRYDRAGRRTDVRRGPRPRRLRPAATAAGSSCSAASPS